MDDYDDYFGKSLGYPLNAAQEYPMARERLYQKTLETVRAPYQINVYRIYLVIVTLSILTKATDFSTVVIIQCILLPYAWWLGVKDLDYSAFLQKLKSLGSKPPKRAAKPPQQKRPSQKPNAKGKEGVLKAEHLILVVLMELQNSDHLSPRLDLRYSHLLMHLILSIIYMDKFNQAKFTSVLRAGLRILLISIAFREMGWSLLAVNLLFVYLFYVAQVNALYQANKLIRRLFARHSISSKLLNQSFQTLDTLPYPVFIFEDKRDKKMPIVSFNLPASQFISRREKAFAAEDADGDSQLVGFLDLLDTQDEGQVLECLQELEKLSETQRESPPSLQELFTSQKSAFTTQISAEVCGESSAKKYDVIMWRMKWMDREVIGAVFNNDAYLQKKGSSRYNSKYLEALNAMSNQTSNVTEIMINNLRKYLFNNLMDIRTLTDSICSAAADLMSLKYLVDNCVATEKNSESNVVHVFSVKSLVTNIIDWQSKDFKAKGINITLLFEKDFPHYVRAKMVLLRTFLFDIFKYLNTKMATGSVVLLLETEKIESVSDEDDDPHGIYLKFILSVQGYRLDDLPPEEFLNWEESSNTSQTANRLEIFGTKNPFEQTSEEQLVSWIKQIKQLLNIVILKSDDIKGTVGDNSQMM